MEGAGGDGPLSPKRGGSCDWGVPPNRAGRLIGRVMQLGGSSNRPCRLIGRAT